MKKVLLASVIILVFAVTGSAQPKIAAYAGGGLSMPMGPTEFKDSNKMGFGGFAAIGYEVNPSFEVVGHFGYNSNSADIDGLKEQYSQITDLELYGGDVKIIEFGVDVKFNIPMGETGSAFKPYLVGGPGMANVKIDSMNIKGGGYEFAVPDQSTTKAAANVGAGFTYMFTPTVGGFLDARFAMVFTEGDTWSYLPIRAGITFKFGGGAGE